MKPKERLCRPPEELGFHARNDREASSYKSGIKIGYFDNPPERERATISFTRDRKVLSLPLWR